MARHRGHNGLPTGESVGANTRAQSASPPIVDKAREDTSSGAHFVLGAPNDLLQRMTDAFFALDSAWRFTYLNNAAERLLERTRDELLGQVVWAEFPESVGTIFEREYTRARETGETVAFEAYYPPLLRWFSVRAYPSDAGDLTVYFQDVSSQRAQELRRQAIADALPQGIIVLDADGRITEANPAATKLLGLTFDELSERPVRDPRWKVIHEDGTVWQPETLPMLMALQTGEPLRDVVMGVRHPARDRYQWLRITILPLLDSAEGLAAPASSASAPRRPAEVILTFEDITEQKRLQDQQRWQAALLDQAHDAIFMWELGGPITYWNAGATLLYGYNAAEAQGQRSHDLLQTTLPVPISFDAFEELLAREGEWQGELIHTARDGRRITVLSRQQALRAPDGRLYVLETARDITDRTQQAAALAEALERAHEAHAAAEAARAQLQAVLEVLPVGIAIADSSGALVNLNAAIQQIWGTNTPRATRINEYGQFRAWWVDDSNGLGRAHGSPVAPEDWAMARALRTGEVSTNEELEIETFDGERKTILHGAAPIRDADGQITGAVTVSFDITDRVQLQRALAQARQTAEARATELEAILDRMDDAVVLLGQDGAIARVNPAYRRLIGMDDSDVYGAYVHGSVEQRTAYVSIRAVDGQPLPLDQWPSSRVLRGETLNTSNTPDVRIVTVTGHDVIVSVSGVPLVDRNGQPSGAVLVLRDTTERAQREQERANMLHVVAHELRTPLTSLKATVQINQRRLERGAKLEPKHFLAEERAVGRMELMINDLLDAARAETAQMELRKEPTDLVALCEQVASDQMASTGRGIHLDLPNEAVMAEADGSRIAQVVANLLSNALKYSPVEADVSLRLRRSGAEAYISVRDTGPGIPPETLPHLFERFYRAPDAKVLHGSGTGLGVGLYLCQQFVQRHGGSVSVESEPGKGATFTVRLPLNGD